MQQQTPWNTLIYNCFYNTWITMLRHFTVSVLHFLDPLTLLLLGTVNASCITMRMAYLHDMAGSCMLWKCLPFPMWSTEIVTYKVYSLFSAENEPNGYIKVIYKCCYKTRNSTEALHLYCCVQTGNSCHVLYYLHGMYCELLYVFTMSFLMIVHESEHPCNAYRFEFKTVIN